MKKLGSNGPEISAVGFGTWELGGLYGASPEAGEIVRAMKAGLDAGMTWIDCSEPAVYGPAEELAAKAAARREDVMVFTKVMFKPWGTGVDGAGVRVAAESVLKRTGRDVIDLFQVHAFDPSLECEETWEAMAGLVETGVARWIGVCNVMRELVERCEKIRHVDSVQNHFSLIYRLGRDDLLPYCRENGIGFLAYGPLGFGLLTGAVTSETRFPDDDWRSGKFPPLLTRYEQFFAPGKLERNLAFLDLLRPVAARLGISLAQLALAWLAHQPEVTGAIAGSRSATHTKENAAAGHVDLSEADLAEIEAAIARTPELGAVIEFPV